MKTCSKCKVERELSEFGPHKATRDGLNSQCRPCRREAQRVYRAKNKEAQYAATKKWKQSPEGREWERNHRLKHRDKKNEASRKWREDNPEKQLAADRSWRERNRGKANAKAMRRHAAKLKRTPLWADLVEIDYAYHAAQVIKDVYGTSWDVDHIIPLQGENVSGLHVQGNLQIMPPSQNRSKGNSFTC